MYRLGDFIVLTNLHNRKECYRISTINAVYYDSDLICYTILFNDGQEVLVDITINDGEDLIRVLCS